MGLRAIRWSLSEPAMFRQQLRAILRASAFGKVRLLVPMLTQPREIRLTLEAIARAKQQLVEAKRAFNDIEVGAMIEVPAAALIVKTFLRYFDFISLGTNDLIQYTLAIDRADETVAHLYDPWHPAVLELIARSVAQARAMGKHVSVCGEMAGDTEFTELLLAMGLRSLSMHPSQIASVKRRILRTDTRRLEQRLAQVLSSEEPGAIAAQAFAARGGNEQGQMEGNGRARNVGV
jgi:phosphotransferase system enzyme I (PtsI)